jgi:ferredoxin
MSYAAEELRLPELDVFPADGTTDVCPTNALTWPPDAQIGPSVEAEECIGCALCVARCPVGAIHVGSNGVAFVADAETPHIRDARGALSAKSAQDERKRFSGAKRRGSLIDDTDKAIKATYQRIGKALEGKHPSFPTLFSRNLLLGVGWNAAMRRRGDTNVRIDIAAAREGHVCAVEVEFSEAVVDAPRNVLDDLAVLIARYRQDKTRLNAFIVALTLPNQRSEYFQVIEDAEKVLGIRMGTVTVGALMLLMWNRRALGENAADLPYAYTGAPSIRPDIERMLGRKIKLSTGLASVLETPK